MNITGSLRATLTANGNGQLMNVSLESQSDGQPFFRGSVSCEWADTENNLEDNPLLDRIKNVADELNMDISSYDDLCLAQAMISDGIDDLGHLGQLYAANAYIDLPKTEAFLDSVAAEGRSERAELRKARRPAC